MASDNGQLERVIAEQREDLDRNLEELVMKAKSLTDWRSQVDAHPFGMLGLALGGGAMMAMLARSPSRRRSHRPSEPNSPPRSKGRRSSLVQDVSSALGAVAATTALEFVAEAVPGFASHFRKRPEGTPISGPDRAPQGS